MKLKNIFRLSIVSLAAIFSFSPVNNADACDYCLLSQGISPLETVKGTGVRVTERYSSLDNVYHGSDELGNPGAKEEYYTTEFSGFWGVSENLILIANVPYKKTKLDGHLHVHADGDTEVHPDKGEETGLGDVSLLARYTLLRSHTLDMTNTVAAIWGVKLPTGKTDGRTEDGAEFLDAHLQLGTGSTDFLAGLSFSHAHERGSISGNILAAITGDGEAGATDHRFGNTLNYDLTGKFRVYPSAASPAGAQFFASLGLNGELMDRETEGGAEVTDSGGHKLYITPGIQAVFGSQWILEATYHHPIYVNMNGTQIVEDKRIVGGISYIF